MEMRQGSTGNGDRIYYQTGRMNSVKPDGDENGFLLKSAYGNHLLFHLMKSGSLSLTCIKPM
jgi:hypothetical protein